MKAHEVEAIIYLARKLGWSLKEIGKLKPDQFNIIYTETLFQESRDEYRRQQSVAVLLSGLYNCMSKGRRTYTMEDFLAGSEPQRTKEKKPTDFEKHGIRMPTNILKEEK